MTPGIKFKTIKILFCFELLITTYNKQELIVTQGVVFRNKH